MENIRIDKQRKVASIEDAFRDLHEAISASERIVLSTHENPDPDGLGSALALCEHLKDLGKDCRILSGSREADLYDFLDVNGWLETYDPATHNDWLKACDLAIVLDLGDFPRLRILGDALLAFNIRIASIDHHASNPDRTPDYQPNVLDIRSSSTGTLVWQYFNEYRDQPISYDMAVALYAAVSTDTGSFKYSNTDVRAHNMAIAMLKLGVQPYEIYQQIYEQVEHVQVRLMGMMIGNIQFSEDNRISWSIITQKMFDDAGASKSDTDGFSEYLRSIKGVEVGILLREVGEKETRISLRSKGKVVINRVAQKLGGGGHGFASGISMEISGAEVVKSLVPMIQAAIEEQLDS